MALVLAVASAQASAGPEARRAAVPADVRVELTSKRQVMDGFGSSARVWTDPHLSNTPRTNVPLSAQREILRHLYTRLGLTRLRPILDQGVQKERGGPFSFEGKLGDAHVALVKQARPFGLRTVFPGPVYIERWMGPEDVGAYADWAMAMLGRWRSQGFTPSFYAPQNEPQVNGDFSPDFLRRVVIELGKRLRRAGFKTKLVVPDDENPIDAYRRAVVILSDPEARQYVGAVAYHVYRIGDSRDIARIGALAGRYSLPVWMTEYSDKRYGTWPDAFDWAIRMHTLIVDGRVSAVDYFSGFFGSWDRSSTMVSLDFENGVYRGKSFTAIYWLTGQWSRFVRPGFRRVVATPALGGVLTSAFVGSKRVVVVSINSGDASKTMRYTLDGGRVIGLSAFRTSSTDQWRRLPAIPVQQSRFSAQLPARSVTTFVADITASQ